MRAKTVIKIVSALVSCAGATVDILDKNSKPKK